MRARAKKKKKMNQTMDIHYCRNPLLATCGTTFHRVRVARWEYDAAGKVLLSVCEVHTDSVLQLAACAAHVASLFLSSV